MHCSFRLLPTAASAVAGGNTTGVCPRWAAVLGGRWGRWGGLLSGCPRSLTLAAAWRWCAPTDCDGLPGAGSDPSSVCESATSSFRPGAPWLRGLSVGAAGDGVPDRGRRPVQPQIGVARARSGRLAGLINSFDRRIPIRAWTIVLFSCRVDPPRSRTIESARGRRASGFWSWIITRL